MWQITIGRTNTARQHIPRQHTADRLVIICCSPDCLELIAWQFERFECHQTQLLQTFWKHSCSLCTEASSALEVLQECAIHLLTYLLRSGLHTRRAVKLLCSQSSSNTSVVMTSCCCCCCWTLCNLHYLEYFRGFFYSFPPKVLSLVVPPGVEPSSPLPSLPPPLLAPRSPRHWRYILLQHVAEPLTRWAAKTYDVGLIVRLLSNKRMICNQMDRKLLAESAFVLRLSSKTIQQLDVM